MLDDGRTWHESSAHSPIVGNLTQNFIQNPFRNSRSGNNDILHTNKKLSLGAGFVSTRFHRKRLFIKFHILHPLLLTPRSYP